MMPRTPYERLMHLPAGIYLLKWRHSGIFIVDFEHISHRVWCFYCWLWTCNCRLVCVSTKSIYSLQNVKKDLVIKNCRWRDLGYISSVMLNFYFVKVSQVPKKTFTYFTMSDKIFRRLLLSFWKNIGVRQHDVKAEANIRWRFWKVISRK